MAEVTTTTTTNKENNFKRQQIAALVVFRFVTRLRRWIDEYWPILCSKYYTELLEIFWDSPHVSMLSCCGRCLRRCCARRRSLLSSESAVRHDSAAAAAEWRRLRQQSMRLHTMISDTFYSLTRRYVSFANIIMLTVVSFHSYVVCVQRRIELPAGKSTWTCIIIV